MKVLVSGRERLGVSVSSAVFVGFETKRLLLLQHAKNDLWSPIGGGMELHEDPIMVAGREALEETGRRVELTSLVGIYPVERGDGAPGIGFVFRGRLDKGEMMPEEGKIKGWNYFTYGDVRRMLAEAKMYKPEYNNRQSVDDYFFGPHFPLDVVKRLAIRTE